MLTWKLCLVFMMLTALCLPPSLVLAQDKDPVGDFKQAYQQGKFYKAFDILARLKKISRRPAVFGKLMGVAAYQVDAYLYAMFLFEDYLNKVNVSPEVLANLVTAGRAVMMEKRPITTFYEEIYSFQSLPNFVRAAFAPELVLASLEREEISRAQDYLPFLRASRKGLLVGGIFANLNQNQEVAFKYFDRLIGLKVRNPSDYRFHLLARLNLGRTYYERQQWRQSINQYNHIPRSSKLWFDALWESSWAHFQNGELNLALGKLHSFISPFLLNHLYPEAVLLRTMVLLELCKYSEMTTTLGYYYQTYRPIEANMFEYLSHFSNPGTLLTMAKYLINRKGPESYFAQLPLPIQIHFKEHEKTQQAQQRIGFIKENRNKSRRMASRGSVGNRDEESRFDQYIKDLEESVYQSYAQWLQSEMNNLAKKIRRKMDEASLVEIEMTLGQQVALDSLESIIKRDRDAKRILAIADEGHEFWPFYNEFWKDELGYYVVNTPSSCVNTVGQ